jgi:hypothetical protein
MSMGSRSMRGRPPRCCCDSSRFATDPRGITFITPRGNAGVVGAQRAGSSQAGRNPGVSPRASFLDALSNPSSSSGATFATTNRGGLFFRRLASMRANFSRRQRCRCLVAPVHSVARNSRRIIRRWQSCSRFRSGVTRFSATSVASCAATSLATSSLKRRIRMISCDAKRLHAL